MAAAAEHQVGLQRLKRRTLFPSADNRNFTSSINLQWKMLHTFLIVYLLQTNVCIHVS